MKKISLGSLQNLPRVYYNVPPCPKCGSRRTGRYLKKPFTADPEEARSIVEKSLRHGELVRLSWMIPIKNAFCEDCGHEWAQNVKTELVPAERIEEEIIERGTIEEFERYSEVHKKKKRTIFGKIFGFLP